MKRTIAAWLIGGGIGAAVGFSGELLNLPFGWTFVLVVLLSSMAGWGLAMLWPKKR